MGRAADFLAGGEEEEAAAAPAAPAAAPPAAAAAAVAPNPPLPANWEDLNCLQQAEALHAFIEGLPAFWPVQYGPNGGYCYYCQQAGHWSIICSRCLACPTRHFLFHTRRNIPRQHRRTLAQARAWAGKAYNLARSYDPRDPNFRISSGPQLQPHHWNVLYTFHRHLQSWLDRPEQEDGWPRFRTKPV